MTRKSNAAFLFALILNLLNFTELFVTPACMTRKSNDWVFNKNIFVRNVANLSSHFSCMHFLWLHAANKTHLSRSANNSSWLEAFCRCDLVDSFYRFMLRQAHCWNLLVYSVRCKPLYRCFHIELNWHLVSKALNRCVLVRSIDLDSKCSIGFDFLNQSTRADIDCCSTTKFLCSFLFLLRD